MAFTSITWGSGTGTFATQTDLETGTDNIKPASPFGLFTYSKWLLTETISVATLFTDIG